MRPLAVAADPRSPASTGNDVRPRVAPLRAGVPSWAIMTGVIVAALLLFGVLNARRQSLSAPATRAQGVDSVQTITSLPPLFMPSPPVVPALQPRPSALAPQPLPSASARSIVPPPVVTQSYTPPASPVPPAFPAVPAPAAASLPTGERGQVLVYDVTESSEASGANRPPASENVQNRAPTTLAAARATMLRARSTTVAQGTVIPAVLESALDSTQTGPARAVVTRDVRGWDGTRVLIPRGSRLFGEANAEVRIGQSRARIIWTRLVRPDGASIDIQSPAGDPLGRIGVKGRVNNHFFARFGAAILQTGLDVGATLATQAANNNSVVVAVPGSIVNTARPLTSSQQIAPTITVPQGTSITVFVARDLDFTSVERWRE